jgi:hypothetical protein
MRNAMNDESRRILDLLAQGKITVDEAQQLLSAIQAQSADSGSTTAAFAGDSTGDTQRPRFLRIAVLEAPHNGKPEKKVNIRVPLAIIRGGIRLGALIPGLGDKLNARVHMGHGINLDMSKLDPAELENVLKGLDDMTIDVDEGQKKVQFHCE